MLSFSLYIISIYDFHIIVKLIVICQYDYFFKSCYSYRSSLPNPSMRLWPYGLECHLKLRAAAMKIKNAYHKKERAPASCRRSLEVTCLFFYRCADNWRMISWT